MSNPIISIVLRQYEQHAKLWDEVARQMRQHHGVDHATSIAFTKELFRALVCKGTNIKDSLKLSMPPELEQAWHMAILNTELYAQFCQTLFGALIPHTTVTDQDPVDVKNARVDALVKKYVEIWGETPPKELWLRERDFSRAASPPKEPADANGESLEPVKKRAKRDDVLEGKEGDKNEGRINIRVKDWNDGSILTFTIKMDTPLDRLMYSWSDRQNRDLGSVRFIHEGRSVRASDTCASLQMEDEDMIEVYARPWGC